jgi:hypothetical protein
MTLDSISWSTDAFSPLKFLAVSGSQRDRVLFLARNPRSFFHVGNTGSNPVGDAQLLHSSRDKESSAAEPDHYRCVPDRPYPS